MSGCEAEASKVMLSPLTTAVALAVARASGGFGGTAVMTWICALSRSVQLDENVSKIWAWTLKLPALLKTCVG